MPPGSLPRATRSAKVLVTWEACSSLSVACCSPRSERSTPAPRNSHTVQELIPFAEGGMWKDPSSCVWSSPAKAWVDGLAGLWTDGPGTTKAAATNSSMMGSTNMPKAADNIPAGRAFSRRTCKRDAHAASPSERRL